ncbi:hypothetical protein A2U01_0006905 [Trifolium medium]|uniref:Uncharacterized protein n=1 Tax=Trifolium medium TaxID=97028 RepID=A0A392MFH5_9FABA|nr:hypothetical protein [Trifolium medium]
MPRQPKMGDRIGALENTMSDLKSTMQAFAQQVHQRGLILSELSKQLGLKETSQKIEKSIEDNSFGLLKNPSEQLDRKLPATLMVTPSVTKNHTIVVDVIKEKNDESMLELMNNYREAKHQKEFKSRLLPQSENITEIVTKKAVSGMRKRNERVVVFEPPPAKSPDIELLVVASEIEVSQATMVETQLPTPKPPHPSESRKPNMLATILPRRTPPHSDRPAAAPPDPEPPAIPSGGRHVIVTKGEKDLETPRAKREFAKVGNHFNLMGQIHKYLPSILHHNNSLHVLSPGHHSNFPLLSHVSPKEQPLPLDIAMYPAYTMQYANLTQVNVGLFFEIFSLWAGVKLSGRAQINNNSTWVGENSNILSQTRNFVFPCAFSSESIASHQKCSPSSNSCYVCEEESQSIVEIREFEQEIAVYGSLSLPLEKFKQVRYKGYQKVVIKSACAFPLCKCFGRHIKRFSVKQEVGALDKDVIATINSYLMSGNWACVLEGFDDKRVWNLLAFNFVTESFNLKAQNEKIVDVSQWMESEERALQQMIQ